MSFTDTLNSPFADVSSYENSVLSILNGDNQLINKLYVRDYDQWKVGSFFSDKLFYNVDHFKKCYNEKVLRFDIVLKTQVFLHLESDVIKKKINPNINDYEVQMLSIEFEGDSFDFRVVDFNSYLNLNQFNYFFK